MNKLYLVGVGPGEPDLITLKAKNVIKSSKTVFYIDNRDSNLAFSIVKDFINDTQETVPLELPMISNEKTKELSFKRIKDIIRNCLIDHDCSFITLGDPAIYSTVYYILDEFLEQVEIVPGISSFSALSAELKIPLVLGKENLAVINLNSSKENIIHDLRFNESIIVLRIVKKRIEFLKETLIDLGLENNIILYSNIGFDNAKISKNIEDLNESLPYMTTILIKKN